MKRASGKSYDLTIEITHNLIVDSSRLGVFLTRQVQELKHAADLWGADPAFNPAQGMSCVG